MTAPVSVAVLLDQLDAARAAATPGVWAAATERADGGAYIDAAARGADSFYPWGIGHATVAADAACIVAEHNSMPRLVAAVRAVLELADGQEAAGKLPVLRGDRYDAGVAAAYLACAERLREVLASALAEEGA